MDFSVFYFTVIALKTKLHVGKTLFCTEINNYTWGFKQSDWIYTVEVGDSQFNGLKEPILLLYIIEGLVLFFEMYKILGSFSFWKDLGHLF